MRDSTVTVISEQDFFRRAALNVELARGQLDSSGIAAVDGASEYLEAAVARLHPLIADDHVSLEVRRAAEHCRATVSSHLLAAEDLKAAGVPDTTVARLLTRAIDAFHAAAAATRR